VIQPRKIYTAEKFFNEVLALPYAENAVGYITIEQKGGNHAPSVENIVANIAY
jgi:hypothetical protein